MALGGLLANTRSRLLEPSRGALLACFVVVSLAGFGHAMSSTDHNENMYLAAARLLPEQRMYSDFAYLQTPYLPYLYALIFALTGTGHYLLVAKVVTWLFWLLSAWVTYAIALRVSTQWAAMSVALLQLLNTSLLRIIEECSNYVAPIPFATAGLYLAVQAAEVAPMIPRLAAFSAAGACLGIAAGFKSYYVAIVPIAAAGVLLAPKRGSWLAKAVDTAAFAAGLALTSAPMLYLYARDREAFVFDNFGFHRLTSRLYASQVIQNGAPPIRPLPRLLFVVDSLGMAGTAFILAAIAVALTLLLRGRARPPFRWREPSLPLRLALSSGAAAVVGTLVAFSMVPSWLQYSAFSVPFLILALAALIGLLRPRAQVLMRLFMSILPLLAAPFFLLHAIRGTAQLCLPNRWEGLRKHAIGERIRRAIPEQARQQPVACLHPVYALEAGLPIYREFATGEFLYWTGDSMTAEERQRRITSSRSTVAALLEREPPSAVVTGVSFTEDEQPLEAYAVEHRYRRVPGFDDLRVYVQP